MYSTFHGLETARRGMVTHQASLYTTGHNIANANTPGYSRQRVNLAQAEPFPKPALNRPDIPGLLGTGVHAESITRVRDQFLDLQYRNENSKYGYWAARFSALEKMEDILNEPSTSGLANSMDKFWNALQDLSVHPEDSGARAVVRDRGKALAETFNYVSDSLKTVQRGISEEIGGTIHNVNTILRQINNLNLQISKVEPHGYIPNDLYDRRDVLVDQLSQIVNIQVERVPSGGNSSAEAEGLFTIKLADEQGRSMGVTLVDGRMLEHNEFKVTFDEDTGLVDKVYIASPEAIAASNKDSNFNLDTVGGVTSFTVDQFRAIGTLSAQMEAYGYIDKNKNEAGTYPEMLYNLDMMVYTFVQEFNAVHRAGWTLTDVQNGTKGDPIDFFSYKGDPITPPDYKGAASRLQVSQKIRDALDNIAASRSAETYGAMKPDANNVDGLGSITVRGTYSPTPLPNAPVDISVQYDKDNDEWSYSLDNGISWNVFPQNDAPNFVLDGLHINVSLVDTSKLQAGETGRWDMEIVAGTPVTGYSGDGSNALALANVKDARLDYGGSTASVHSFYQALIGDMAVSANESNRMMENTDILRDSVDTKRMSTSNVSLDEEFTDMVRFQHGYNAAARMITMIDEMLDRIVNQMGIVGR